MSDFVDYNKRSVDLPTGCKDLWDVLTAHADSVVDRGVHKMYGGILQATVSVIPTFVERVFRSQVAQRHLSISPPDRWCIFDLISGNNRRATAKFIVSKDTAEHLLARDYSTRHGFAECAVVEFHSMLPALVSFIVDPLPVHAEELASLVVEFFHQVSGLAESGIVSVRLFDLA